MDVEPLILQPLVCDQWVSAKSPSRRDLLFTVGACRSVFGLTRVAATIEPLLHILTPDEKSRRCVRRKRSFEGVMKSRSCARRPGRVSATPSPKS